MGASKTFYSGKQRKKEMGWGRASAGGGPMGRGILRVRRGRLRRGFRASNGESSRPDDRKSRESADRIPCGLCPGPHEDGRKYPCSDGRIRHLWAAIV